MNSKLFRPPITLTAIALFIFSSRIHSAEAISIDDFIKHSYPNKEVKVISGKLSPGSDEDFVLCLTWHEAEEGPMEDYGKIVIIKKTPVVNLQVIAQSRSYQMYRTTKNDIAIKNGILKYTYGYSNGCCSGTTYEYKFRRNSQGKFQLIGKEENTEEFDNTGDGDTKIIKSGVSTNYNTQKTITWSTEKGKRSEHISTVRNAKIIILEDFSAGDI